MAIENDLASEISDYILRAQGLETTRKTLVERLLGVVKTQIIPELIPLLPAGYSIDKDRINLYSVGGEYLSGSKIRNYAQGEVPTGFSLSFELLYDGKPISGGGYDMYNRLGSVQKRLEPKLEELAQKYGLETIQTHGEPGHL